MSVPTGFVGWIEIKFQNNKRRWCRVCDGTVYALVLDELIDRAPGYPDRCGMLVLPAGRHPLQRRHHVPTRRATRR